jgi:DNA uptake protein ComE-like DNA-binding protein
MFKLLCRTALCLSLIALSAPAQTAPAAQSTAPQTIAARIAADAAKLDINTATAAQLKALPGIGDALAARIIAGRPYTAKNQLTRRGILTQDEYNAITEKIIAHRPRPQTAPAK